MNKIESDEKGLKTFDTLVDRNIFLYWILQINFRLFFVLKDYQEITNDMNKFKMMSECFETIKLIMGVEFLSNFNIKQLISYFGKMKINALSISNEDLSSCIATGLYLSASSLNHSCYPNSVAIFDGSRLTVRSIADIKKNEEVYLF